MYVSSILEASVREMGRDDMRRNGVRFSGAMLTMKPGEFRSDAVNRSACRFGFACVGNGWCEADLLGSKVAPVKKPHLFFCARAARPFSVDGKLTAPRIFA